MTESRGRNTSGSVQITVSSMIQWVEQRRRFAHRQQTTLLVDVQQDTHECTVTDVDQTHLVLLEPRYQNNRRASHPILRRKHLLLSQQALNKNSANACSRI